MKLLMIGPQACGKGTQGEKLSEYLGIPLVTGGDLLRKLDPTHPRYPEIMRIMNAGELVPQDFLAELYKARVAEPDANNGFILDGWCRKLIDLTFFDPKFDKVVIINIPREESVKRISGRRLCSTDGKVYNIYTLEPSAIHCAGELTQRADDTEEAVNRRLDIYYTETQKVTDHFKNLGIAVDIDGLGTPDEVFARIKEALNI
jgi:adenylate kinase